MGAVRTPSPAPKHASAISTHWISQQNFLGEAVIETCQSRDKSFDVMLTRMQLIRNTAVAHDRPGYQLGKHRNVTGKIDKRSRRLRVTSVEVDAIAH